MLDIAAALEWVRMDPVRAHRQSSHGEIPKWPTYSVEARPTMIFDEECRIKDDPYREERLAWSGQ